MGGEAFNLTGRPTVQTLASLQNQVDLHLVRNFDVFKIGELQRAVFIEVGAHLGRCLQSFLDQFADRVVTELVDYLLRAQLVSDADKSHDCFQGRKPDPFF